MLKLNIFKDAVLLDLRNQITANDTHLIIDRTTVSDSGEYECRIENQFGNATRLFKVKVASKLYIF